MDDIPNWAIEEAQKRIDAYDGPGNAARNVLAAMIAQHVEPPVDPDAEAVLDILSAWYGERITIKQLCAEENGRFDNAVSFYREHASKFNG